MASASASALLEEIKKQHEPWILYKHIPKNILLILLSIACIPVSATIAIVSLLITYFSGT
jgi:catechol O-methyltransferase